jgi:hyperosmotically inducible protein
MVNPFTPRTTLSLRNVPASPSSAARLIAVMGCADSRGQETAGAYVDDTAITTAVTDRFVDNKEVDASSISVETLNGTERMTAEYLAWKVTGVAQVKNEIAPRP